MYKLVAIDLDGTLLNSYGEVSENTKEEIKKAINNGVEVVLASGRPISSVEDLANDLHANHYLISGNGAIVYDMQKSQIVNSQFWHPCNHGTIWISLEQDGIQWHLESNHS